MLDEVYGEVNKFKKACNAKQPEELLLVSVSFCCIVNLNQGRIYGRGLGGGGGRGGAWAPPPPIILYKKKKKKKRIREGRKASRASDKILPPPP